MAGRVQDKVTIITGAGSGIGEACMELFAREGAIVIGCGRRTDVLDKVLKKVTDAGGRGMVVQADLSDEKQAQNVVDETLKAYGRVDILVHSASVGWSWSHVSENSMNDIATTPPDKWREVIGINLNACYYMCHGVLQPMLEQGGKFVANLPQTEGVQYFITARSSSGEQALKVGSAFSPMAL